MRDTELYKIILKYEISSSWWASWIGWDWGQRLAGEYFKRKVRRKFARYIAFENLITQKDNET